MSKTTCRQEVAKPDGIISPTVIFWRINQVFDESLELLKIVHTQMSITVCSAYDYHYPHVACVCLSLTPPPLCLRRGGSLSQEPRGLLALRHALLLWKLHLGRHHAGKQPHRLFPTQQSHPAGLSRMVRKSVRGCWWFWGENVWRSHTADVNVTSAAVDSCTL